MSGDNATKEASKDGGISPTFQHWVTQVLEVLDSELKIQAVAGDASPRRYFRVTRAVCSSSPLGYRSKEASEK